MTPIIEIVLSCRSWQEAQGVADCLFSAGLAKSIEFLETTSKFVIQEQAAGVSEIKLVVQSVENDIKQIRDVALGVNKSIVIY